MAKPLRLPQIPALSWDDCRLLVESVQDYAIFMLDTEGFVATWNRGAEKIKGYKAEEIIGRHFSTFYPEADVAADKPGNELVQAERDGRIEDEGWRVRKDGTLFWANVVITALRDERGRLRGFAKVTRDLTQSREAIEQLRQSEERLRLLVGAVSDYAIYMLDPEGRVTTWNLGAEKLKGYATSEILGQHFSRFFPEDARREGKPERELELARAQGRFEEEGWRIRKDGARFWANIIITPVRNDAGEVVGFAKVTRDLTERQEAEETARRLAAEQAARAVSEANEARFRALAGEAEEANRVKDEFLATVSHELRTPLNAILGWATLLQDRLRGTASERALEIVQRNAQAQAQIIDDILDVSRIITGKLRLDLRATDLSAIVRAAFEVVAPAATAKRLQLVFRPPEEPAELVADPVRLQQIAWNLLSNAVKFTPPGGTITVEVERQDSSLVLKVSDTGRGIDLDFMPLLFNRFTQADSSITRRVGGLGLGLSIVRHLVDLHGGQVSAASKGPDTGATFTVTLPVRAATPLEHAASRSVHPPPLATARGELEGVRVLVVDDEQDARELLQEILGEAGCNVTTAGSTAEALVRLREQRPDVLISDIGMPEEDGLSLMRRIRALGTADGADLPAIALTAYAGAANRAQTREAGFDAHLAKPVRTDDLLKVIEQLKRRS
jgi:PAS domain S-box-containing protein